MNQIRKQEANRNDLGTFSSANMIYQPSTSGNKQDGKLEEKSHKHSGLHRRRAFLDLQKKRRLRGHRAGSERTYINDTSRQQT